jgi:hypothetical protein
MHHWHGPYRVIELISPNNIRIQDIVRKKIQPVVHVSRVKKCHNAQRPKNVEKIEIENDDIGEEDGEYEVKEILKVRKTAGEIEYLIEWTGYPRSEATWESSKRLRNCDESILDFHKKTGTLCYTCGYRALSTNGLKTHSKEHHDTGKQVERTQLRGLPVGEEMQVERTQ